MERILLRFGHMTFREEVCQYTGFILGYRLVYQRWFFKPRVLCTVLPQHRRWLERVFWSYESQRTGDFEVVRNPQTVEAWSTQYGFVTAHP